MKKTLYHTLEKEDSTDEEDYHALEEEEDSTSRGRFLMPYTCM